MRFGKPYPYDYRRPRNAKMTLGKKIKRIFKVLADRGILPEETALGFLDEVGAQNKANTVRVWSFSKPKMAKNTSHFKMNTAGFYALKGQSVHDYLERSNGQTIIEFLKKVKEANREFKAVIVFLDNAPSHIAGIVQQYCSANDIYLGFLPPYSPDLNPIEFIWKSVKRYFSISFPKNPADMKAKMSALWNKMSQSISFARQWIKSFLIGKPYSMGFGD